MSPVAAQIQKEYDACAWYLALSYWAEVSGFPCLACYARLHSCKERSEAQQLEQFVIGYMGEEGPPQKINMLSLEFKDLKDATSSILDYELEETYALESLCGKDPCIDAWIYPMICDQIREVSDLRQKAARFKSISKDEANSMDWVFFTDSPITAPQAIQLGG